MKRFGRSTGLMVCCALMVSGAGCRRFRPGIHDPYDVDVLDPSLRTDFDLPMGMRSEFGEQVLGLDFQPVLFGFDRFDVRETERVKIEAAARYLRDQPRLTLVVEGHTCERGTREYNLALGERRALAVRAYLIGLGIPADRVYTVSFGKDKPAAPGRNEQAWARNRRAEFVFYR